MMKYILIVACSISMLSAVESPILSVSAMTLIYSEGYSAKLQNGKTIEVTRCDYKGPLYKVTRLSVIGSKVVARGNDTFENKTVNDWFIELKNIYEKQYGIE